MTAAIFPISDFCRARPQQHKKARTTGLEKFFRRRFLICRWLFFAGPEEKSEKGQKDSRNARTLCDSLILRDMCWLPDAEIDHHPLACKLDSPPLPPLAEENILGLRFSRTLDDCQQMARRKKKGEGSYLIESLRVSWHFVC